ncbi:hypothetical protein VTI28DRAFT_790 [Corynascus sepedonium]
MTSHNPAVSGGHHSSDDIPMTHPTENGNSANSIDDIWGSDETYHHNHNHHHYYHHHHHHDQATQHHHNHQQQPHQIALDLVVSDIPRLSQSHQTAGYRDGIAAAKARTAQHGFDEGYPLGAHIGARAGQLLGVLEGLAAAVGLHALSSSSLQLLPTPPLEPSSSSSSARPRSSSYDEARRLEGVLAEARRELSVGGVFDGQYWASDGTWRYQVGNDGYGGYGQAKEGGNGRAGEEAVEFDGENVVFPDVAEAHPLLRKWSRIVRAEAARYGVDWEVLKDEVPGDVRAGGEEMEEERDREREGRMKRERGGQQPAVRGREALAW